jgi:hypothetical protein
MSCIVGQPPCSSDPDRSNTYATRTCSLALIEQRFKRAIDSSLPQKREDDPPFLAIAYSGGLGSTVLLDLASRLLAPNGKDNSPRRRWKEIHVLHIEKEETNCSSTAQWATIIGRYPEFKFKTLRLADDFHNVFPRPPQNLAWAYSAENLLPSLLSDICMDYPPSLHASPPFVISRDWQWNITREPWVHLTSYWEHLFQVFHQR